MQKKNRVFRRAVVDGSHCVACGCCVKVCPLGAIEIYRGVRAAVNAERCVGCGRCAAECPASVIEIREAAE
ncbi:MAG: 4Fe-4S binding protein [Oscillospiraceae bacterium]|nr:4Fe-4S binding protein [Oscillospiraceae bacterium]